MIDKVLNFLLSLPADKLWHFVVGLCISAVILVVSYFLGAASSLAALAVVVGTGLIAWAKEKVKDSVADWWDFVWTTVGAATAVALVWFGGVTQFTIG